MTEAGVGEWRQNRREKTETEAGDKVMTEPERQAQELETGTVMSTAYQMAPTPTRPPFQGHPCHPDLGFLTCFGQ